MVNFFIFLIQINYYKNVVQIIWIKKIDEMKLIFTEIHTVFRFYYYVRFDKCKNS